MESLDECWRQRRVFLFSHPRTASNLLTRILSGQQDWRLSEYNFLEAHQYTRYNFDGVKSLSDMRGAILAEHEDLIDQGHCKLQRSMTELEHEQKHVLIKEHANFIVPATHAYWKETEASTQLSDFNPTIFSDAALLSWRPIILIRNPITVYESWLRAEGVPYPDLDGQYSRIYTTFEFQRRVYDWYLDNGNRKSTPIILDADEVIESREALCRLCETLGMDKDQLLFHWDAEDLAAGRAGCNERYGRYLRTIRDSTGVDISKSSKHVKFHEKKRGWTEEFGSEIAATLAQRVTDSWPDYEYMWSRRLV